MKGTFPTIHSICWSMLLLSLSQAVPVSWSPILEDEEKIHDSKPFLSNQVCTYDNEIYHQGQRHPTTNPCETCICEPPGFSCTLRQCEAKPGCKALHKAGQCCPDFVCDCYKNGRTYGNGERVEEPNPCNVCYCRGGEIQCTGVTCYTRDDCEPHYIPGRCCPKYDHCPAIDPKDRSPHHTPAPPEDIETTSEPAYTNITISTTQIYEKVEHDNQPIKDNHHVGTLEIIEVYPEHGSENYWPPVKQPEEGEPKRDEEDKTTTENREELENTTNEEETTTEFEDLSSDSTVEELIRSTEIIPQERDEKIDKNYTDLETIETTERVDFLEQNSSEPETHNGNSVEELLDTETTEPSTPIEDTATDYAEVTQSLEDDSQPAESSYYDQERQLVRLLPSEENYQSTEQITTTELRFDNVEDETATDRLLTTTGSATEEDTSTTQKSPEALINAIEESTVEETSTEPIQMENIAEVTTTEDQIYIESSTESVTSSTEVVPDEISTTEINKSGSDVPSAELSLNALKPAPLEPTEYPEKENIEELTTADSNYLSSTTEEIEERTEEQSTIEGLTERAGEEQSTTDFPYYETSTDYSSTESEYQRIKGTTTEEDKDFEESTSLPPSTTNTDELERYEESSTDNYSIESTTVSESTSPEVDDRIPALQRSMYASSAEVTTEEVYPFTNDQNSTLSTKLEPISEEDLMRDNLETFSRSLSEENTTIFSTTSEINNITYNYEIQDNFTSSNDAEETGREFTISDVQGNYPKAETPEKIMNEYTSTEKAVLESDNITDALADIIVRWVKAKKPMLSKELTDDYQTKPRTKMGDEITVNILSAFSNELLKIANDMRAKQENATASDARSKGSRNLELEETKPEEPGAVSKMDIETIAKVLAKSTNNEEEDLPDPAEDETLKYNPFKDGNLAPVLALVSDQLQFLKVGEEQPIYMEPSPENESRSLRHGVLVRPDQKPIMVEMVKVVNGKPVQTKEASIEKEEKNGEKSHSTEKDNINHSIEDGKINHSLEDGQINHSTEDGQINHSTEDGQINHSTEDGQINHTTEVDKVNHSLEDGKINHSIEDDKINHSIDGKENRSIEGEKNRSIEDDKINRSTEEKENYSTEAEKNRSIEDDKMNHSIEDGKINHSIEDDKINHLVEEEKNSSVEDVKINHSIEGKENRSIDGEENRSIEDDKINHSLEEEKIRSIDDKKNLSSQEKSQSTERDTLKEEENESIDKR